MTNPIKPICNEGWSDISGGDNEIITRDSSWVLGIKEWMAEGDYGFIKFGI